jgi:hypothetical protein
MAEKTYTPTDGMASAARRALKWKKEGKRGGTTVGLARANQLANKEPLSQSTVMRMHSFFSRHAVDKKATGFNSGEEGFPSPGRVAWDLWGGDAGASWSKQKRDQIMNERMNKSIWSGVFFPADEPEVMELAPEEDVPLDEPGEEEVREFVGEREDINENDSVTNEVSETPEIKDETPASEELISEETVAEEETKSEE